MAAISEGVIAYSATRLSAVTQGGEEGWTLSVYRSVIVEREDALYAPVRELLDQHCTAEVSSEERDDNGMMFGRAVRSKWTVWAECPGEQPHDCAAPSIPFAREEIQVGTVQIRLAV